MADVLLVCIREEDKDDFIVELIKGLMSRGLTVSYAGTFYSERKDQHVYDKVTNLQFFVSTYFREAQMKSEDFKTWKGFLANIDFEQIDARLVIYVITCTRKINIKELREEFRDSFFLENLFADVAVELIRNSFEMSFFDFESHYPELFNVLSVDEEFLDDLKDRVRKGQVGARIEWENDDIFNKFIRKLLQREHELKNGRPREETLQELDQLQKKVELDCLRDPSKGKELVLDFFGSDVIEIALELAERHEIIFYSDIRKKISQKSILCIYYEEEIDREKANLYFYSEKRVKEEEKDEERETQDEKDIKKETKESKEFIPPSPYRPPKVQRDTIELKEPRELYDPKTIGRIIDNHVMLALHPNLVHIYFPTNDFLLEVDPEEPEIGFLSRKVDLRNCETLDECLRIDTSLREKLLIYKLKENKEGKKFYLSIGDKKESQEEDIVILGRVEDLYKVFVAGKKYGSSYQLIHSALKFLTPLAIIFLFLNILWTHSSESSEATEMFVRAIFVLVGVAFAFWASRNFALNYILEPTYRTLKLITYIVISIVLSLDIGYSKILSMFFSIFPKILSMFFSIFPKILSMFFSIFLRYSKILSMFFSIFLKYLEVLDVIVLTFSLLAGIFLLRHYIRSAIFYQLNNLFEIIDNNDILEIENPNIQSGFEDLNCLKCEQFQTIVKKDNNMKVFFNSSFFLTIKCVHKKARTVPLKFAYSSGVFHPSRDEEEPEKTPENEPLVEPVVELLYRKSEAWRFLKKLESFLFGKGMIESKDDLNHKSLPSTRFIYLGRWNGVMEHIRNAIPVFPQSVLFRNMIILAVLSGLLYNALQEHVSKILDISKIEKIISWNIISWNFVLYLITPFIVIFLARRLKFQFWKVFLFLSFYLLVLLQPLHIWILITPIFVVFLYLIWFFIRQAYYSFRIWLYEKIGGTIISVENGSGVRGVRIQKNTLVTQLTMVRPTCIEDKRVYFNERFFEYFVMSNEWKKITKE